MHLNCYLWVIKLLRCLAVATFTASSFVVVLQILTLGWSCDNTETLLLIEYYPTHE